METPIDLQEKSARNWFNPLVGLIWILVFIVGSLFKIQHWPGANMLLMLGSAGGMAYVIRALYVQKKVSLLAWAIIAINIYMLAMIMLNIFYDHFHGHEIATKLYLPYITGLVGFSALFFGVYWMVKRNQKS